MVVWGWVFIVLSGLVLIGGLQEPHQRDGSIARFLEHPGNLTALICTIGYLAVLNMLTIPALVIAIAACRGGNPHGKPLLLASTTIILVLSGMEFLPSSTSASQESSSPTLVSPLESEFQVTFPSRVRKKVVTAGQWESVAYESTAPAAGPYLRAEFIPYMNQANAGKYLRAIVTEHAQASGLQLPEITVGQDSLGMVGTYAGTKRVSGITLQVYGKLVLGEYSSVNCSVVEARDRFPSQGTVVFLNSITKSSSPSASR